MDIIVPVLYEDMEPSIIRWNVKKGDQISVGDTLFSLETDKAVFDVEAEKSGILKKIICVDNSFVAVLEVVGIIDWKLISYTNRVFNLINL